MNSNTKLIVCCFKQLNMTTFSTPTSIRKLVTNKLYIPIVQEYTLKLTIVINSVIIKYCKISKENTVVVMMRIDFYHPSTQSGQQIMVSMG